MSERPEWYLFRCIEGKPKPKGRVGFGIDLRTGEMCEFEYDDDDDDDDMLSPEDALRLLKSMTNQDFGFDVEKWRAWLEENLIRY